MSHTPLVLIILDGWGYRENPAYNAIAAAKKPHWDMLWHTCPHTLLVGSGLAVGLPQAQMGNSEVGHLTMGAGRTIYQEFTRIDQAIADGEFFHNAAFLAAIEKAKANNKALHVLGLLSPGGVHSHERQIHALLELAAQQQLKNINVHAFLDGRDTPPQSALASLQALEEKFQQLKCGRIASLVGRYYAMDRDKRWERIQRAYDLLTVAKADYRFPTASEGLQAAYARNETDEFVHPTVIGEPVTINDGDVVVFMNYRADRARELTRAFTDAHFSGFQRQKFPQLGEFVSLTQYAKDIKTSIAFPPQTIINTLGEYLSQHHIKQLRIAETEKYAHVTFFFNGGVEAPYPNENRILVPSLKVATYDLQPQMSASEVTDKLVEAIQSEKYGVIICNFANPDMVGHTGQFAATVQAIEVMDHCIGRIITALRAVGGEAMITADHGNAEMMYDETTKQAHTAHTTELVPFIYAGRSAHITHEHGTLADIAPTMLTALGLSIPPEMTGKTILSW